MHISRRHFIKQSIVLGTAAMGAAGFLGACTSRVTRQSIPQTDPTTQAAGNLTPEHAAILYHASLAPSGHNTQPWKVRVVQPGEWIVEADPERRLPHVDPQNREVMLSLGAFTENLVLAAGAMGFRADAEIVANHPFSIEVVRIHLHKDAPRAYPLQRLKTRMTVKHGYLPQEIDKSDIEALAAPFDGRLFYFPNGTPHAECIREGAIEHFRTQTYRKEAQSETAQWLRLSNRQAKQHRDGLTVRGMEIRGMAGWYVGNFAKPEDFLNPPYLKQSVDHTARLARQGGGWLVITSRGDSVADQVETGRKFERMALVARERMIALHPMTQFLEEDAGMQQIAAHHSEEMHAQFILRVGYLKTYPQPVSLRRPVAWFVVQKN
jgi:hypothetical protein